MSKYTLRPNQELGKRDILKFFAEPGGSKRGVVIAPTAAGKSIYIASAVNDIVEPVLVIQPSKELLKQNYEKYISFGNEASIYSASLKSKEIGHVTFATPQSIASQASKFAALGVRKIFIDECHLSCKTGSTVHSFIKAMPKDTKIVGLTATPLLLRNTMSGALLSMLNRTSESLFTSIIHCTQIQEMIDNKFWSPLVYEVYEQDKSSLQENSNSSDYTKDSLNKFFFNNKIEDQAIDIYNKHKGSRVSALIFAPTIEAAESICRKIPGAQYVHSKMDQKVRDSVITAFKNMVIPVVVNVNILGVGFDHPELDFIIETRPTMSIAVYYQHLGRGVRIHPNKKDVLICDLSGNVSKFGKVEDLYFEEIPGWGWGLFSGKYLLSERPLKAPRVLKDGLGAATSPVIKMWFGKYNGMELDKIPIDYMKWMLSPDAGFTFNSDKLRQLKKEFEKYLAI